MSSARRNFFARAACLQDRGADASPGKFRIGVHGTNARGITRRIKTGVAAPLTVITAIKRRARAPTAAADKALAILNRQIGAVLNEPRIEAHNLEARIDLFG